MKKLLCILVTLVLMLPVCASAQEVVNVFNWEDYIDESVLAQFEQETGIHVNYMRFTTNEDMIVQVEANPGAFDVCFPSDYIVERMLSKDMLAEIDYSKVPNAQYILDNLRSPDYDPDNVHSLPYMWGTVGILYNTTMVEEPVDSWGILWDSKYKSNVFMLDSFRDSMGVTLKYLGHSMNTRDIIALESCKEKLIEQKKNGIVKAYQVDETKDKMVAGEAALAVMWSGDAQYAIDLNPDLAYSRPSEGSNIGIDAMVIPRNAQNMDNALKFIDFLCRPDIAYRNFECIYYASPITAVQDMMSEEDLANPALNPSEEALSKCEFFHDITENLDYYNRIWIDILA